MIKGVIFSDESGHDNSNRYGAICTISGPRENLLILHRELETIVSSHNTKEIKFKKVNGKSKLEIAKKFVDKGLDQIKAQKIRAHVLVWDKQDKRHTIKNRCDNENLKRMYYHILRDVKKDWKYINDWAFYPDELSSVNWQNDIVNYIENTVLYNDLELFNSVSSFRFPNYQLTVEKDSQVMYNIQLADLLAGIVRNSRQNNKEYRSFLDSQKQVHGLFDEIKVTITPNLKPKLELMHYFKEQNANRNLGVGFSKNNYFETFNKKNNIFIWHYNPQSELDKAPIKKKKI